MQDNITNTNINSSLSNMSPNTNSIMGGLGDVNNILVPTSNLSGEIVSNKNSLYIKIFIFVVVFIILIGGLFYILSSKNKNVPVLNNPDNSFPSLNVGTDFGGETYVESTSTNSLGGDEEVGGDDNLKEVSHIWPRSVVGSELITLKVGTSTEKFILFMDKLTGNIYKTSYPALENTRLTNATLQNVYRASFSKDADFVVALQGSGPYYKLITSRLSSDSDQGFSESEVDKNVLVLISSKTENLFYYLKINQDNTSSLLSFAPNTGEVIPLNTFKFSDIFISGEDEKNIYISSKPASNVSQLTISVNKKTGNLSYSRNATNNKYLLGDIIIKENSGLVSVSDSINYKSAQNLSLKSFADKCTVIKNNYLACGEDDTISDEIRLLDYFNMGKISFTDSLSVLNLSNGEKTFIPVSLISGEPLDVYNVNPGDDYLTFQNKNDESLWLVDLIGL